MTMVFFFWSQEALATDTSGNVLEARVKPVSDGDELIKSSQENLTDDEIAFHKVMAIMYPIRNALMYDIAELTQIKWDTLIEELTREKLKKRLLLRVTHQEIIIMDGKEYLSSKRS